MTLVQAQKASKLDLDLWGHGVRENGASDDYLLSSPHVAVQVVVQVRLFAGAAFSFQSLCWFVS